MRYSPQPHRAKKTYSQLNANNSLNEINSQTQANEPMLTIPRTATKRPEKKPKEIPVLLPLSTPRCHQAMPVSSKCFPSPTPSTRRHAQYIPPPNQEPTTIPPSQASWLLQVGQQVQQVGCVSQPYRKGEPMSSERDQQSNASTQHRNKPPTRQDYQKRT